VEEEKDYKKIAEDAKKQMEVAKAANRRHASDLTEMKRVSADARELLQQGRLRQRKRESTD
jgi:hypothetical protein